MSFADTYREQVVQSRQDRARKALFLSRIVGVILMIAIAFVLRVEPALRTAIAEAGMDLMTQMTGRAAPVQTAAADTDLAQSQRPRDRVKVNRGSVSDAQTASQSRADAQAQAEALGQRLRARNVGSE